jgi:hypothetical protein
MGARTLIGKQYTLERDVVRLYGMGIGAGAANLTGVKGKGITSIVRTGVGAHTITLANKWNGFLNFAACIVDTTTPDDWEVTLVEELVATSKTIKIAIFKGGTAAELTTDELIKFEIVLSNTAQKPTGY